MDKFFDFISRSSKVIIPFLGVSIAVIPIISSYISNYTDDRVILFGLTSIWLFIMFIIVLSVVLDKKGINQQYIKTYFLLLSMLGFIYFNIPLPIFMKLPKPKKSYVFSSNPNFEVLLILLIAGIGISIFIMLDSHWKDLSLIGIIMQNARKSIFTKKMYTIKLFIKIFFSFVLVFIMPLLLIVFYNSILINNYMLRYKDLQSLVSTFTIFRNIIADKFTSISSIYIILGLAFNYLFVICSIIFSLMPIFYYWSCSLGLIKDYSIKIYKKGKLLGEYLLIRDDDIWIEVKEMKKYSKVKTINILKYDRKEIQRNIPVNYGMHSFQEYIKQNKETFEIMFFISISATLIIFMIFLTKYL